MRIKSISLSWFRGASESATLETNSRSLVIYGQNGTGKSTFVDAIEHAICDGKINHLAHEYSGKKQEKGIRNTHAPDDQKVSYGIVFKDDSNLTVTIGTKGDSARSGTNNVEIANWDYKRTVLRQDEISRFIASTKGNKYSELLPLLGLAELEIAAENLRKLASTIEKSALLREKKGAAAQTAQQREHTFGNSSDSEIFEIVASLHKTYCSGSTAGLPLEQSDEIEISLGKRINSLTSDNQRHLALKTLAATDIDKLTIGVRQANTKLVGTLEPLIVEKLEVLRSANNYSQKLVKPDDIACPACGQVISPEDFKAHVKTEEDRLREIITVFQSRRATISAFIDTLKNFATVLRKPELEAWRDSSSDQTVKAHIDWIDSLDPEGFRQTLEETMIDAIEARCPSIIQAAASASRDAPPEISKLSSDKATVEAARIAIGAINNADEIDRLESLGSFISSTERNIRTEIHARSKGIIDDISEDIGLMWSSLHPEEPIKSVRLVLPDDPKSIDIALKFHGKDQDSPRLTLSEGYRNSLGLCIFLALAKRDSEYDRPLFLDDVVVSFDRNHRGMLVALLTKHFVDRQLIILTHDRDWFSDLKHQLDNTHWSFKTLLPYESPTVGIRWSDKTTNFADARAHLSVRPDFAVNDARKIMDVELAIVAEKLQLKLPYLRGERNDHRMCHEFLKRLENAGKKCFQKMSGDSYVCYNVALEEFNNAANLLVSWANRGSHSDDVAKAEAIKVIEACEEVLAVFTCDSCKKSLWRLKDDSSKLVRCDCGNIRWRYGKNA